MGSYDDTYAREVGLKKLPAEDFVLEVVAGDRTGMWLYRTDLGGGSRTGYTTSKEQGQIFLDQERQRQAAFWREKIEWMNAGDRAPDERTQLTGAQMAVAYDHLARLPYDYELHVVGPRNVLRHGGRHYTVRTRGTQKTGNFLGHGGRLFRWYFLDDPQRVVQESNDVWTQGIIPARFRDLLPDNVEFLPAERKPIEIRPL